MSTLRAAAMGGYLTQVLAVAGAEVSKLRHDPWELVSRAIQPVLWLVLFGEVMAQVRGLAPSKWILRQDMPDPSLPMQPTVPSRYRDRGSRRNLLCSPIPAVRCPPLCNLPPTTGFSRCRYPAGSP